MSDEKTEGPVMIPAVVGNTIFRDKERLVARVAELEEKQEAFGQLNQNQFSVILLHKKRCESLEVENAELRKALESAVESFTFFRGKACDDCFVCGGKLPKHCEDCAVPAMQAALKEQP